MLLNGRVRLSVGVLEHLIGERIRECAHAVAQAYCQRLGLFVQRGKESVINQLLFVQVGPDPLEGVTKAPCLNV